MGKLTVFTPTYNRAYILSNLYNSLLKQTNKDFEWIIVDDGSTDNTNNLVNEWIKQKKVNIKYINQNNKGKPIAFNTGVNNCQNEYFFCVDSDDYLTIDAIETILEEIEKIDDDTIGGIIALRGSSENNPIGTYMPLKVKKTTLNELYEKYKFKGDTALIYKTKLLKKYPFVLQNQEIFIGEKYVYDQIDINYKMILLNKVIYICKYLNDGYTKNTIEILKNNPYSYMEMKLQSSKISKNILYKIKHMAGYIAMGLYVKDKKILRRSNNKMLTILSFPLGLLIYRKRFKE